jgi:hypothetical protein
MPDSMVLATGGKADPYKILVTAAVYEVVQRKRGNKHEEYAWVPLGD